MEVGESPAGDEGSRPVVVGRLRGRLGRNYEGQRKIGAIRVRAFIARVCSSGFLYMGLCLYAGVL